MTEPMKTASERLDELLGSDTPAPALQVSLGEREYPADIVAAANKVWSYIQPIGGNGDEIAAVIAAERERCAKICEAASRGHVLASSHSLDPDVIRSHSASAFSLSVAAGKIRGEL